MNRRHLIAMGRCVLMIVVLAVLGRATIVHAQPAETGKLTIATYNILNMFDVFDNPYTEDEGTRVKPRREIEQVAALIRQMNADVVAFQELENVQLLHALVEEFLPDMGYTYIAAGPSNSHRGITNGIISRVPIASMTSYRHRRLTLEGSDKTWKFARDLVQVTLQLDDQQTLDLFIVHFKSKRTTEGDPQSANWRLAEAIEVRKIFDKLLADDPDAWAVIVGDFNDTADSAPLARLLKNNAPLIDLHPNTQANTYLNEPYRNRIDYILATPALAKHVVPDSAKVITDEALLKGSDHAPVVATFDVGE